MVGALSFLTRVNSISVSAISEELSLSYNFPISDEIGPKTDAYHFEVENMLYKRATGYEYDEVKEEYEDGVLTKRTVTKKTVVPDTSAQIFWLKNRKPTEWRDRREVDNTVALEKLDEVLGQIKGCE